MDMEDMVVLLAEDQEAGIQEILVDRDNASSRFAEDFFVQEIAMGSPQVVVVAAAAAADRMAEEEEREV